MFGRVAYRGSLSLGFWFGIVHLSINRLPEISREDSREGNLYCLKASVNLSQNFQTSISLCHFGGKHSLGLVKEVAEAISPACFDTWGQLRREAVIWAVWLLSSSIANWKNFQNFQKIKFWANSHLAKHDHVCLLLLCQLSQDLADMDWLEKIYFELGVNQYMTEKYLIEALPAQGTFLDLESAHLVCRHINVNSWQAK